MGLVRTRLSANFRIVFIGVKLPNHQSYHHEIQRLVSDLDLEPFIEDLGFVQKLEKTIASLDLLVLSSVSEACPIAVLKAMATGIPVVATDVGGVHELLLRSPEEPAGIVVPPRDSEAIATGVLELLHDSEKARRMGQSGRRLAEKHFSLDACVRRHLDVYIASLGTRPRPGAETFQPDNFRGER